MVLLVATAVLVACVLLIVYYLRNHDVDTEESDDLLSGRHERVDQFPEESGETGLPNKAYIQDSPMDIELANQLLSRERLPDWKKFYTVNMRNVQANHQQFHDSCGNKDPNIKFM